MLKLHAWMTNNKAIGAPVPFDTQLNIDILNNIITATEQSKLSFIRQARLQSLENNTSNNQLPIIAGIDNNQQLTTTFKVAIDYDNFLQFLYYFKQGLENNTDSIWYAVAINYLLQLPIASPIKQNKAALLFNLFLKYDATNALKFHKEHYSIFAKNFTGINILVNEYLQELEKKHDITWVTQELTLRTIPLLEEEKNAATILHLLSSKIDDVRLLSTLMIAFLQKGVTAEQIINHYILHDLILYNFPEISLEKNEITRFYNILQEFPEGRDLISAAKTIGITIPGCNVLYSLIGNRTQENIRQISKTEDDFKFSITENNFKNLLSLFGDAFLHISLKLFSESADNNVGKLLSLYINKTDNHINLNIVANFINQVAKNTPGLLKSLATLIDNTNIKNFMHAHLGAIFHLVRYRQEILTLFHELDGLRNFIMSLQTSNQNHYDTIGQLISLFQGLKNNNQVDAKKLVYNEIINFMLTNPTLWEDQTVQDELKRYSSGYKGILQRNADKLIDLLNQSIQDNIFNKTDYCTSYLVEDDHFILQKKFTILKQLYTNLNTQFPLTRYDLFAYIVKKAIQQTNYQLQLKDFLLTATISTHQISDDTDGLFERSLIEILAVVDNENIRRTIIDLLEQTQSKNKQWTVKQYGGYTILNLAIEANNWGFIRFFIATFPIDAEIPQVIAKAFYLAATHEHWDIVQSLAHIKTDNKPSAEMINEVLKSAISEGQLDVVKVLTNIDTDNKPNSIAIAEALNLAAILGHLHIVAFFCNLTTSNRPNATNVSIALDNAMGNVFNKPQWNVVKFLCNIKTNNQPDVRMVAWALKAAAEKGELNVVQFICNIETDNRPTSKIISEALIRAANAGAWEVVKFLCNLHTVHKPTATETIKAIHKAVRNNRFDILQCVCNLATNQIICEFLLHAAAFGYLDIVKYICALQTESKPDADAVDMALRIATEKWHLPVIKYLCALETDNQPNADKISVALNMAARQGQVNAVKYFCTLESSNKLGSKEISNALQIAVTYRQIMVIQYLVNIDKDNKPDINAIDTALRYAVYINDLTEVEYLSPFASSDGVSQALKKAIYSNQLSIVRYLCTIETPNKVDAQTIVFLCKQAFDGKNYDIVKSICSMTTDNKLSEQTSSYYLKMIVDSNDINVNGNSIVLSLANIGLYSTPTTEQNISNVAAKKYEPRP